MPPLRTAELGLSRMRVLLPELGEGSDDLVAHELDEFVLWSLARVVDGVDDLLEECLIGRGRLATHRTAVRVPGRITHTPCDDRSHQRRALVRRRRPVPRRLNAPCRSDLRIGSPSSPGRVRTRPRPPPLVRTTARAIPAALRGATDRSPRAREDQLVRLAGDRTLRWRPGTRRSSTALREPSSPSGPPSDAPEVARGVTRERTGYSAAAVAEVTWPSRSAGSSPPRTTAGVFALGFITLALVGVCATCQENEGHAHP